MATPLATTFARRYQLVCGHNGMLKAYEQGIENAIASNPSKLAIYRATAKATDPKLAEKAIERVKDTLSAIFVEFPDEKVKLMLDACVLLKVSRLTEARNHMLAQQTEGAKQEHRETQMSDTLRSLVQQADAGNDEEDENEQDQAESDAVDSLTVLDE